MAPIGYKALDSAFIEALSSDVSILFCEFSLIETDVPYKFYCAISIFYYCISLEMGILLFLLTSC